MFVKASRSQTATNLYWGYMPPKVRVFSKFTIPLSFLSGLYMVYYSIAEIPKSSVIHHDYEPNGKYIHYLSLCLLLFGANLWPISLFHITSRLVSVLSLVITAVGAILLMGCVLIDHMHNVDRLRNAAIVATSILVFQTGIMDLIVWSFYFQRYPYHGLRTKRARLYKIGA
jgi:hypothetical protein